MKVEFTFAKKKKRNCECINFSSNEQYIKSEKEEEKFI